MFFLSRMEFVGPIHGFLRGDDCILVGCQDCEECSLIVELLVVCLSFARWRGAPILYCINLNTIMKRRFSG